MFPLLAALMFVPAAADTGAPLLLGVVGDPRCGEHPGPVVRVLFTRRDGHWVTLATPTPVHPVPRAPLAWFIAFDGRPLGSFRTAAPTDEGFYFSDLQSRWLVPVDPDRIPLVENRDSLFGDWCGVPLGRPLVVLNRRVFADPDGWKRAHDSVSWPDSLLAAFRATAPGVYHCPGGSDTSVPFAYTARDLQLMRAYRSQAGAHLVDLKLDRAQDGCDEPENPDWDDHWFEVDGHIRYLGSALNLVDAGDYDGDGVSELLFSRAGYSEDGYTLFSGRARVRVDYLWHYH